jgi:hypothetical protein
MLKLNLDAKNTDGGGGSSIPQDDKVQESSTAEQAAQEQTKDVEESTEQADDTETATDATGDEQTDDQQDSQSQQDDKAQEDANVVLDKPEDKDLPFHKEPRFQELVTQKNEARQQLEAVKPLVAQAQALQGFLAEHNIPPQEFQAALTYLQLKRTDPAKAYQQLKVDYDALAMMNGETLPADLQVEVAAATMSPERAKEIARLRGQTQYQSWQQQNGQMNQQQQQIQMIQAASSQWTQNKQIADPDLKPGSNLWQLVQDKINAQPPFRSPQEAYAGSEKAYTDAKAFLAKLQPRLVVPSRRVNQHRNSSANDEVVVKTAEDVTKLFIANGGRRPSRIKYA